MKNQTRPAPLPYGTRRKLHGVRPVKIVKSSWCIYAQDWIYTVRFDGENRVAQAIQEFEFKRPNPNP